jgi:hypothetical protein
MKKAYNILILLVILFCAFSLILYFINISSAPIKKETFNVTFSVADKLGLAVEKGVLSFGQINREGSAVRNINIDNGYNFSLKVKALATKNIADFIFAETNFTIYPNQNISLPINLYIPKDTAYGNYSGKITIELYRAQ